VRENIKNRKILVVGDTIVDKDIELQAIGLSLESPTIKASVVSENSRCGGAANVAKHLGLFGCDCTFVTSLIDPFLKQEMETVYGIKIICLPQEKENIKARYWLSKGDSRYKYLQINSCNLEKSNNRELNLQDKYDAVLISDYRCGFVSDQIIKEVSRFTCKKFACSQLSDKNSNMDRYSDFDAYVLNEKEYASCSILSEKELVITMGSNGCKHVIQGISTYYPAVPCEAKNTIGAGDSFCAAFVATENPKVSNAWASYCVSIENGCPSLSGFENYDPTNTR
jgi:bifunctional ADP-heptose synthase (sugar kinase/adenylyltransferase)